MRNHNSKRISFIRDYVNPIFGIYEGAYEMLVGYEIDFVYRAAGERDPGELLVLNAQRGYYTEVEKLIKSGAPFATVEDFVNVEVNIIGRNGFPIQSSTALHQAAANNHLKVMQLLIEHGADVNAATSDCGWTPLNALMVYEPTYDKATYQQSIELLVKNGADLNSKATCSVNGKAFSIREHAIKVNNYVALEILDQVNQSNTKSIQTDPSSLQHSIDVKKSTNNLDCEEDNLDAINELAVPNDKTHNDIHDEPSVFLAPFTFLKNTADAIFERLAKAAGAYAAEVARDCPNYFPPGNTQYWTANSGKTFYGKNGINGASNTSLLAPPINLPQLGS